MDMEWEGGFPVWSTKLNMDCQPSIDGQDASKGWPLFTWSYYQRLSFIFHGSVVYPAIRETLGGLI